MQPLKLIKALDIGINNYLSDRDSFGKNLVDETSPHFVWDHAVFFAGAGRSRGELRHERIEEFGKLQIKLKCVHSSMSFIWEQDLSELLKMGCIKSNL